MNAKRSPRHPATESLLTTGPEDGLLRGWGKFWFAPTAPTGLHVVRVLAALLFLFWLLPFAGNVESLFGLQGWFDQQAYREALQRPDVPPEQRRAMTEDELQGPLEPVIGWSLLYPLGNNPALLRAAFWGAIAVFVLFGLGVMPRLTAVLTWVAVVSFTSNPAIMYDGDSYLLVLAFYLMVGYVLLGQRTCELSGFGRLLGSWGTLLFRRGGSRPSLGANLALRLLQIHMAIIMVTSGLHKLQFGDWWGGYALWYPLYPAGRTTLLEAQTHAGADSARFYLTILSLGAYAVLFWQIGFPLFAWRRSWRPVLLLGALLGWLADSFLYELPLMGPALFIGCLSFVSAEEWQRFFALLGRLPGLAWLAEPKPAPPAEPEKGEPAVESEESSTYITVGQR